jgi:arylsulfatase
VAAKDVAIQTCGTWAASQYERMIQRHQAWKMKYPDEGPATGRPYDGIENLRPETKAVVDAFIFKQKVAQI